MDIRTFRQQYNNENMTRHNIGSVAAGAAQVPGRLAINSAGEASATVMFPVKFTTQPYFTYGFELQEGEGIIGGKRPTGSAYVYEWVKIERLPNTIFYVGAKISVITTGLKYQKMICNYSFSGTALSNPS